MKPELPAAQEIYRIRITDADGKTCAYLILAKDYDTAARWARTRCATLQGDVTAVILLGVLAE
jgi:hypothetical protein